MRTLLKVVFLLSLFCSASIIRGQIPRLTPFDDQSVLAIGTDEVLFFIENLPNLDLINLSDVSIRFSPSSPALDRIIFQIVEKTGSSTIKVSAKIPDEREILGEHNIVLKRNDVALCQPIAFKIGGRMPEDYGSQERLFLTKDSRSNLIMRGINIQCVRRFTIQNNSFVIRDNSRSIQFDPDIRKIFLPVVVGGTETSGVDIHVDCIALVAKSMEDFGSLEERNFNVCFQRVSVQGENPSLILNPSVFFKNEIHASAPFPGGIELEVTSIGGSNHPQNNIFTLTSEIFANPVQIHLEKRIGYRTTLPNANLDPQIMEIASKRSDFDIQVKSGTRLHYFGKLRILDQPKIEITNFITDNIELNPFSETFFKLEGNSIEALLPQISDGELNNALELFDVNHSVKNELTFKIRPIGDLNYNDIRGFFNKYFSINLTRAASTIDVVAHTEKKIVVKEQIKKIPLQRILIINEEINKKDPSGKVITTTKQLDPSDRTINSKNKIILIFSGKTLDKREGRQQIEIQGQIYDKFGTLISKMQDMSYFVFPGEDDCGKLDLTSLLKTTIKRVNELEKKNYKVNCSYLSFSILNLTSGEGDPHQQYSMNFKYIKNNGVDVAPIFTLPFTLFVIPIKPQEKLKNEDENDGLTEDAEEKVVKTNGTQFSPLNVGFGGRFNFTKNGELTGFAAVLFAGFLNVSGNKISEFSDFTGITNAEEEAEKIDFLMRSDFSVLGMLELNKLKINNIIVPVHFGVGLRFGKTGSTSDVIFKREKAKPFLVVSLDLIKFAGSLVKVN